MKTWKQIVAGYPDYVLAENPNESRMRTYALSNLDKFVEYRLAPLHSGDIHLQDIDKDTFKGKYAHWKKHDLNRAEQQVLNDLYHMAGNPVLQPA